MPILRPEDWQPAGGVTLEDAALGVVKGVRNVSVIAGPGSGKTELLAQRAQFLLQTGLSKTPKRILAISFKRDAARNLKERVAARCTTDQVARFDSFTFDGFAKNLVDRFRAAAPDWCRPPRGYNVAFTNRDEWNDFVRGLSPPKSLGGNTAAQGLTLAQIESWGPLPSEMEEPETIQAWVASKWWERALSSSRPGISFAMIGRLAEAILRYNVELRRALHLTYSHVFLDEFQDTTKSQYRLLRAALADSAAVLTAVGDTRQRIMTWAGAESEVFSWFDRDFQAARARLQFNYRSNRRIVDIINALVRQIEPDAVPTLCGRRGDAVPDNPSTFWIFDTDHEEAEFIANFIADDIANSGGSRVPSDYALLVRVRANEMERQLEAAFSSKRLHLRNEARAIAGLAIQDLLADEFVRLIIGIIRLAIGVRSPEVYATTQDVLDNVWSIDHDNVRETKRGDDKLKDLVRRVKTLVSRPPAEVNVEDLIGEIMELIGTSEIVRSYRQFEDAAYFSSFKRALSGLIAENSHRQNWHLVMDAVEGLGSVRLMTVHKSKGLEYHTVFVVGLHQRAFFGFRDNQEEETNTFFVALSRARERVYFTRSRESGDDRQIRGLIEILGSADVPFVEL